MDYKKEYDRWVNNVKDKEIYEELLIVDESRSGDAHNRELSFSPEGPCGTSGASTNQMNIYVVAKATQGLANYLGAGTSVVIGYDSSIKSHAFANCAASVLAANGIKVRIWPDQTPVAAVAFAVRRFKDSAGIMITESHNLSKYNGYKVYGPDGCQITTEAAAEILEKIIAIDTFADVKYCDFLDGVNSRNIEYIPETVLTSFIEEVKENAQALRVSC